MFDFSRGEFDSAITKLKAVLRQTRKILTRNSRLAWRFIVKGILPPPSPKVTRPNNFVPQEQLVHTNLSLFYMKSGDKVTAEKHGLQAKIESWREDAARAKSPETIPGKRS